MSLDRLCVDIDNVLARTDEIMRDVIRNATGGRVQLRYEDVREFRYTLCEDANGNSITDEEWSRIHVLFSDDATILSIAPIDNAQMHLTHIADRFQLHFSTSRLPRARRATVEWLEAHRFPPHDLHFLQHGEKHVSLGQFFAAVEDDYDQAVAFARSGTPAYLIEHPWNKDKPAARDISWASTWSVLATSLLEKPGHE